MHSPLRPIAWLALGLAVIAAPIPARAQVDSADLIGVRVAPAQTQSRGPELSLDDLDRVASTGDSRHDGLFRAISTAYFVAAAADLSISMYQINRGVAREGAFGAQWQDSPVAFAVSKGALAVAFWYGLRNIRKERPKTAFILGIAATAFEGYLAYRSAQIGPPAP
jgi:hypothetical protein